MGNIFTKYSFEQAVASLTNHSIVFSDELTESRDFSNHYPDGRNMSLVSWLSK